MPSSPASLLGRQRPRVTSHPEFTSSRGDEAVGLAALAGLHLDDWQAHVLRTALAVDQVGGRFSAFEVGLIVARQNGKGSVLEARELWGLFLGNERLILHSAHEYKTAQEAFLRIKSLIDNTDSLRKRVKALRTANGEQGIELLNGNRLRFVARSKGSGRGFSGDCVILDEAYELTAEQMAALLPTLSARPNPQLWYTSSAGMASSHVLTSLRERGVKGEPGLAYLEWSADPDASLDDRAAWEEANPGLGIRITEETIARERRALPAEEFARERLSIWATPGGEAIIEPRLWALLADQASSAKTLGGFGFDVQPDGIRASVGVAGGRTDGLLHIELLRNEAGTDWCVPYLTGLWQRWGVPVVLDPRSPAGAFQAPLEAAGVTVVAVTTAQYAAACAEFVADAKGLRLRHQSWPELNAALESAKRREIGDGGWGWARKQVATDISPLVAVTLALHAQRHPLPARVGTFLSF